MRRLLLLGALILLICFPAYAQEAPSNLEKTFTAGNALLEQKKYVEALAEYRKILAVEPDLDGPLRNGAMAAYFAGDYKTALAYYRKIKASDHNDGFIRSKLVQVYQAIGDEKARDAERKDLITLHKSGKDTSSLAKRSDFCREQYRVGSHSILVYEPFVFAPRSDDGYFAVRYQFIVADESGKMKTRIEVGWNTVKKNSAGAYVPDSALSAYYFDAYYPTGAMARLTMGLFEQELSYTATKAHVQAIVEGKIKPSGGTPR